MTALILLGFVVLCVLGFAGGVVCGRGLLAARPDSIHDRDTLPEIEPPNFDAIDFSRRLAAAVEWAAPVTARVSVIGDQFTVYWQPQWNALITDEDQRAMIAAAERVRAPGVEVLVLPG